MVPELPPSFKRWERGKENSPKSPCQFSLLLNIIISALFHLCFSSESWQQRQHTVRRGRRAGNCSKECDLQNAAPSRGAGAQGIPSATGNNGPVTTRGWEREQTQSLVRLCFLKQSKRLIPSAGNDPVTIPSSRSCSSKFHFVKMPLCKWAARLDLGTGGAGSWLKQQIARGGKMTQACCELGPQQS